MARSGARDARRVPSQVTGILETVAVRAAGRGQLHHLVPTPDPEMPRRQPEVSRSHHAAIRTYVREAHKAGCRLTGWARSLRAAESGCFARRLHVNHRAADRPLPSGTGQRHPRLPAVRRRRGQRTGGITAATTGAKPRRADAGTVGVGWSSHPRASKASKGWVSRGLPLPCGRHGCPSGPPGRGGRIGIRCAGRGGPAVASGSSTGRPAGWPRCVHRWWPQVPALLSPGYPTGVQCSTGRRPLLQAQRGTGANWEGC